MTHQHNEREILRMKRRSIRRSAPDHTLIGWSYEFYESLALTRLEIAAIK